MNGRFIGLDVHKEVVQVCCLEADGTEVFNRQIRCSRGVLLAWAQQHLCAEDELALEATTNTWAIVELFRPFVKRVAVSNPLKTKAIAEAKVKTDKVDARVLAQLLRVDFLPSVWIPDAHTQRLRRLTHRRAGLGADMTTVKNRIHAVLHQRLIESPVKDLFRQAGMAWLRGLELDTDGRAELDSELRLLQGLCPQARTDRLVNVRLRRTLPLRNAGHHAGKACKTTAGHRREAATDTT